MGRGSWPTDAFPSRLLPLVRKPQSLTDLMPLSRDGLVPTPRRGAYFQAEGVSVAAKPVVPPDGAEKEIDVSRVSHQRREHRQRFHVGLKALETLGPGIPERRVQCLRVPEVGPPVPIIECVVHLVKPASPQGVDPRYGVLGVHIDGELNGGTAA